MADLGTLMMKVSADTNQFEKSMANSTSHLSKFAIGAAIAGAAAVAAFTGASIKAAVDFENQMASTATLIGGDFKDRIKELGEEVKGLAITTGTSTELLSDGLYQVVSAFGDTADSMEILETAAKGAKAGNSTVTDSVNLLSAVMKGYGDTSAEAAKKASDLAFMTVKLGQTTFPELAASMGKVIPLASAMKVGQEELFGAMATLTGVTGGAAEVSTQLRGVIQGMMKPTDQMAQAMKNLGYENGQTMIETLGLGGTLDALKESVNGNETELSNMFGSIEAVGAVLALTGSQAENFAMKTAEMQAAAGATDEAFKIMSETFKGTFDRITQAMKIMMIDLGEKLLPLLQTFADWLMENMPVIQEVVGNVFKFIGVVVMAVWEIFSTFILPILQVFYDVIQKNLPEIKDTFDSAFKLIGDILYVFEELVKITLIPALELLFDKFNESSGTATAWDSSFKVINSAIQQTMAPIQLLIDIIKKAIEWYEKLRIAMGGEVSTRGIPRPQLNEGGFGNANPYSFGSSRSAPDAPQMSAGGFASSNPYTNKPASVQNTYHIQVRSAVDVLKEVKVADRKMATFF